MIPVVLAGLMLGAAGAHADDGITDDSVKIGSIVALSGPAAPLSIYVRQLAAWLKYVSAQGGVKFGDGKIRKIEPVLIDSGGQPARALAAARELVEQQNVFVLASPHGTNENLAIVDYLNAKEVPQAFVNSPATTWGADSEKHPWTFGFPPVPGTQVSILLSFIKSLKPDAKIAILHANDQSGQDALAALKKLTASGPASVVAVESYEVTDATVDSQVVRLASSGADVFIDYAIGRHALQAIQKANEIGWKPLRLVETSTASSGAIKKLPPDVIDGIVSAAYIKDPTSSDFKSDPAVVDYQKAMDGYFGSGFDPTAQPLGAAEAAALIHTFETAREPTRAAFVAAARKLNNVAIPFLLPGIKLGLASSHGFPITQMQIIKFQDGNFVRVGDVRSGSPL
jgi:branched-chain amino acid transport system substrate-binding protein